MGCYLIVENKIDDERFLPIFHSNFLRPTTPKRLTLNKKKMNWRQIHISINYCQKYSYPAIRTR